MIVIIASILSLLSVFSFNVKSMAQEHVDNNCISSDRVIGPILHWNILSKEFAKENNNVIVTLLAHNPLDKRINFINAKLIFIVKISTDTDSYIYNLITATYYNEKNIVMFNRVYEQQKIKLKYKVGRVRLQTECFDKIVKNVI